MNRDLDPVALKAAIAHAKGGIQFGMDNDVLISAAILTYQKVECKPMEDAPTCGRTFEAWSVEREVWEALYCMDATDAYKCWKEFAGTYGYFEKDVTRLFLCWREQRKPNWVKV